MRILMLTQFYLPFLGGEELLVQNLSRELAYLRGHDVAIVTLEHPAAPAFEVEGDVRIYRLSGTMQRLPFLYSDTGRRFAPPFPDPRADLGPEGHRGPRAAEIVHAHNWLVHSFLPLKAWSGARLVLSLHDNSLQCARKDLMYQEALAAGRRAEVRRVLRRPLRPGQGAAHPPSPTGPHVASPPGPRWTTTSPSATPWPAASGLPGEPACRTRSCRSSSPTTWAGPGATPGRWPSSPRRTSCSSWGACAGSRGSRSRCGPTPGWRPSPRPWWSSATPAPTPPGRWCSRRTSTSCGTGPTRP